MEYQKNIDSFITKNFNKYVRNPQIIYGIMILFLALYASHVAPQLPHSVTNVFDNTFFKIFIFILILWIAQVSPSLSILIAIAFMMLINYVNNKKLFEFIDNTSAPSTSEPSKSENVVLSNTPVDAVKATNILTLQALDASKGNASNVKAAVDTIQSVVPNPDKKTVDAVSTLVNSAMSPAPGNAEQVATAMNTVTQAINEKIAQTITPQATLQAVQVLANAATTPGVNNNAVIATAANIVSTVAPETTPQVATLVTTSAQPSSTKINVPEVTKVVQNIVDTITTPPPAPMTPAPMAPATTPAPMAPSTPAPTAPSTPAVECYPMRHVDMSKVVAEYEGVMLEEYQAFKPSM